MRCSDTLKSVRTIMAFSKKHPPTCKACSGRNCTHGMLGPLQVSGTLPASLGSRELCQLCLLTEALGRSPEESSPHVKPCLDFRATRRVPLSADLTPSCSRSVTEKATREVQELKCGPC